MVETDLNLAALLKLVELPDESHVQIHGTDPVIPSRFGIGRAAATALAACGVTANELWKLSGGANQNIIIEVDGAAVSLVSFMCQRLEDDSQPARDPNRPLVAFYQTRDSRWVHLHGAFPKLAEGTLKVLGCRDESDSIARAVGNWLYTFGLFEKIEHWTAFDPAIAIPYMTTSQSGFGQLHHLDPILRMSLTPPRWEQVTEPLGTHAAAW